MSITEYARSYFYGYGIPVSAPPSPSIFNDEWFHTSLIVRAESRKTTVTETRIAGNKERIYRISLGNGTWPLFLVFDDTDMQWKEYLSGMPIRPTEGYPVDLIPGWQRDTYSDLVYDVDKGIVTSGDHVFKLYIFLYKVI